MIRSRNLALRLHAPVAVFLALACGVWYSRASGSSPDKAKGAFATGQYRNLFVETGHSQQEIRDRLQAAFLQLFHGDPRREAVYFPAGTNANGRLAFIHDVNSRDVRS